VPFSDVPLLSTRLAEISPLSGSPSPLVDGAEDGIAAAFRYAGDSNLEGTKELCSTLSHLEETKAKTQLALHARDDLRDVKKRRDEWVMVCPPFPCTTSCLLD
jgi:hypothetical protein